MEEKRAWKAFGRLHYLIVHIQKIIVGECLVRDKLSCILFHDSCNTSSIELLRGCLVKALA
jgi:hypothetical protein